MRAIRPRKLLGARAYHASVRRLLPIALACALGSACDDGRARPSAGTPGTRAPRDGGAPASDAAAGGDDARGGDGGLGIEPDAASLDGGPFDDGVRDGGADRDLGMSGGADAATPLDAAVDAAVDAGVAPDSGPPSADLQLSTSCGADFGGDPIVSHNGSIAVGSLRGFMLAASLQFDFRGQTGVIRLGTRHRIDTGLVVNLVTQSTWTNLSQDSAVVTGMAPDTIGGTLNLRSYDGPRGIMDVELIDVRLQNPSDRSFCVLNGRVRTTRLGR